MYPLALGSVQWCSFSFPLQAKELSGVQGQMPKGRANLLEWQSTTCLGRYLDT